MTKKKEIDKLHGFTSEIKTQFSKEINFKIKSNCPSDYYKSSHILYQFQLTVSMIIRFQFTRTQHSIEKNNQVVNC